MGSTEEGENVVRTFLAGKKFNACRTKHSYR